MKMFERKTKPAVQKSLPKPVAEPLQLLPSEAMREDMAKMVSSVKKHLDMLNRDKADITRQLTQVDSEIEDAEKTQAALVPAMDSLKAIRPATPITDNVKAITEALKPVEAAE